MTASERQSASLEHSADTPSDSSDFPKSLLVSWLVEWRRRELNERPSLCKVGSTNDLRDNATGLSVDSQCCCVGDCHRTSPHDATLNSLIGKWPTLSDEAKRLIALIAGNLAP